MCEDLTGKLVPPAPPVPGSGNAAGKRLCGMCTWRTDPKNAWVCRTFDGRGVKYPCPAPDGKCAGFFEKPSVVRPDQPKKKGLPVPEGVKFLYVGAPRGKTKRGFPQHQGVVTIAYITPAPGILHMGFSFCNPGQKGIPPDGKGNGHLGRPNTPPDRWCRATGRDMALARLIHPLVIPFLYSPKRTVHEVTRAVLSHDFGRLAALTPGATMWEVPSWTRGLAKRMSKTRVVAIYRLPGSAARIIANLKEFEIKHLPLAIMAQMMRDIAALGND